MRNIFVGAIGAISGGAVNYLMTGDLLFSGIMAILCGCLGAVIGAYFS